MGWEWWVNFPKNVVARNLLRVWTSTKIFARTLTPKRGGWAWWVKFQKNLKEINEMPKSTWKVMSSTTPHAVWVGGWGSITQIFYLELYEISRFVGKIMHGIPTPWDWVGGQFKESLLLGIKVFTKTHVSNTHSMVWGAGVRVKCQKIFLARNCMKCADLDRNIMFLIPHPSWGSGGRWRSQLKENVLLLIEWNM